MSSTSDSRVDTGDRDPYDAEPVRNDPWATGPAHTTQDDQTERFVPGPRDPDDHDGHLYASDTYAEPETAVLPEDTARHDPDATVVVTPEGQHTHDHSHDGGEPHDDPHNHAHDHADGDENTHDHTHDDATAVGVAPVDTDGTHETKPHDPPGTDYTDTDGTDSEAVAETKPHDPPSTDYTDSRPEPEVETVALPPAEPVAIVEPVEDRPGDFAAVPVVVPTEETAETPTELKPGDVPVEPVAGFFAADAAQGLRDRWREAQFGFVDDPRQAVEDVKALVSEAVDQFTAAVSAQRDELDAAAGEDTEQYRVAVQRYRSFFDRLLGL